MVICNEIIELFLTPPNTQEAETAAELDALLPAILDRAFKGEL
jgi:hypothetical protein